MERFRVFHLKSFVRETLPTTGYQRSRVPLWLKVGLVWELPQESSHRDHRGHREGTAGVCSRLLSSVLCVSSVAEDIDSPRLKPGAAQQAYEDLQWLRAVVVDDAYQGVTEVVRGNDLVPSTPRQLLLYRTL